MRNLVVGYVLVIGLILVVFSGIVFMFNCQIFHFPCPDSLKNSPIIPDSIVLVMAIVGISCMIIGVMIPVKNRLK